MAMPESFAEVVVGLAVAATIVAPFASSLEPCSMSGSMAPAVPLQQSTASSQELLAWALAVRPVGLAFQALILHHRGCIYSSNLIHHRH